jgi:hypothetical protein
MKYNTVWECKIGCSKLIDLPNGVDFPMRQAIREAFFKITGENADFIFSGWGAELTQSEQNVVDNKS